MHMTLNRTEKAKIKSVLLNLTDGWLQQIGTIATKTKVMTPCCHTHMHLHTSSITRPMPQTKGICLYHTDCEIGHTTKAAGGGKQNGQGTISCYRGLYNTIISYTHRSETLGNSSVATGGNKSNEMVKANRKTWSLMY